MTARWRLKAHEREVLDRLNRYGNPVGWTVDHRDRDGNLVLRAERASAPAVMVITRRGLIYS